MNKTLDIVAPILGGNGGTAATPGLGMLGDVPIQPLPCCGHLHHFPWPNPSLKESAFLPAFLSQLLITDLFLC